MSLGEWNLVIMTYFFGQEQDLDSIIDLDYYYLHYLFYIGTQSTPSPESNYHRYSENTFMEKSMDIYVGSRNTISSTINRAFTINNIAIGSGASFLEYVENTNIEHCSLAIGL